MAVSLLTCEWSLHKELLAKQVEVIHRLIHKEQIQVKFSWILHSNNAISDHLMHQVCTDAEDLVIWTGKEEEVTSVMIQAVSSVKECWSCGCYAMKHAEIPIICEECFHNNVKKGFSDPIEDIPILYFLHTH